MGEFSDGEFVQKISGRCKAPKGPDGILRFCGCRKDRSERRSGGDADAAVVAAAAENAQFEQFEKSADTVKMFSGMWRKFDALNKLDGLVGGMGEVEKEWDQLRG